MRVAGRGFAVLVMLSLAAASVFAAGAELSPRAQEAVKLLDASDAYQRQTGFLRLEALREPASAPIVRQYLDNKVWQTRAFAARAVAAIEGLAVGPELVERMPKEKHAMVRVAILLGVEPFKDPRLIPAVAARLRESSPEVRMAAIDVLSRIDHPRAREALLVQAKRETNRDVRRVLDDAMRRLFTS